MASPIHAENNEYEESFEDFFEASLCGYVITDNQGKIVRANTQIATWAGSQPKDLKDKKISDLLSVGAKIYYHTHLWPLLRMQGFFDEVVLELAANNGNKLRVMMNAMESKNKAGNSSFIKFIIFKATDRLQYEKNLQEAKRLAEQELTVQRGMVTLREQLIAVLGHDLRNPLSAVTMAVDLLNSSADPDNALLLQTIKRSSIRMTELINNIMDFARTRLGEGILLNRKYVLLEPIIQQVVEEMKIIYPKVQINYRLNVDQSINCDADRVAQLLSNLLANAITHGNKTLPVHVEANITDDNMLLSVTNHGTSIPVELHDQLFAPFTRESGRASQNGLGLGLYICSEIAKAHNGTLTFTTSEEKTTFTLCIRV